jgi:hypothetical protein
VHEKVVWLLTSRGSVSLREISARASWPTLSDSFIRSIRTRFSAHTTKRIRGASQLSACRPSSRSPTWRGACIQALPARVGNRLVHKDFFDDWVKRHVEVYAQKFATVALRHQTEIATGSRYVAGMGVNSWTGEKRPDGVMPLDASSCSKAAAGLSLKASNSGFGPRVQRTFDIKYFVPLEPFRYRRSP